MSGLGLAPEGHQPLEERRETGNPEEGELAKWKVKRQKKKVL